jgi:hypothetical protein
MLTLEELRKSDPKLANKSDEEVAKIRDLLYELGHIALDSYEEDKKNKS